MARKKGSHGEITGPRVRAAARRLFAEQGYLAVSMRQLAAEVGVQAGALYLYAEDKEALLAGLIGEHLQRLLDGAPDAALPAPERLELMVRHRLAVRIEDAEGAALALRELRHLGPERGAPLVEMARAVTGRIEAVLAEGHRARDFQVPEPALAAEAIGGLVDAAAAAWSPEGKIARDRLERLVWNMVRKLTGA